MTRLKTLFIVLIVSLGSVQAQDWEYSLHLNSGLFSYSGASVKRSYFIFSDTGYRDYTKTPFGSKNGISFGIGSQMQRISSFRLLYGMQAGYEHIKSRVDLYPGVPGCLVMSNRDMGRTFLTNQVINVFPFIGKRFELTSGIYLDLVLGSDFSWNFETFELTRFNGDRDQKRKYRVYYDFENPTDQIDRRRTPLDIRPRIGITGFYNRIGLNLGYSHGIMSYRDSMEDLRGDVYSRFIRMGIVYRM